MERLWPAELWVKMAIVLALIAAASFARFRMFSRDARMRRFARRRGFRFHEAGRAAPTSWSDLACLQMGENRRVTNWIEGVRGGRGFTTFDYHYEFERAERGPSVATGRGPSVPEPTIYSLLPFLDGSHDPAFCAAVVECPIPPGARTAGAKRGFAPWRVEFGTRASVVRSDDGLRSPEELLAAMDRLNAALDGILRNASAHADRTPRE